MQPSIRLKISGLGVWLLGVFLLLTACKTNEVAPAPLSPERPSVSEYMQSPAILVFSGTRGWRHDEGISGADLFFAELATERGFGLFTTELPGVFNTDDLSRFDVIVFNNVSGPVLNTDHRAAFEAWMQAGGAWIGLHGAGDYSMGAWEWYQSNLIGAQFVGHTMDPRYQDGRLVKLSDDHPVTAGLPEIWIHHDEWYSFDRAPDMPGLTLLLGLDETSYNPTNTVVKEWPTDLRMGETPSQHPLVWARCGPGFRSVYSAIGDRHESFRDPNYRQLLFNAFDWVTASHSAGMGDCPS